MEQMFLTIEQCRHLQELGLGMSDAIFCLIYKDVDNTEAGIIPYQPIKEIYPLKENSDYIIPTYTLQEVLEKLPKEIDGYLLDPSWDWKSLSYLFFGDQDNWGDDLCLHKVEGKNLFDSAYVMLCWCLEKGYIK